MLKLTPGGIAMAARPTLLSHRLDWQNCLLTDGGAATNKTRDMVTSASIALLRNLKLRV
jgi:hypothetical protein